MTRPTQKTFQQVADCAARASRLHIQRLASAFEVTAGEVLDDWALVVSATEMDEQHLCEHLTQRHAWDGSD